MNHPRPGRDPRRRNRNIGTSKAGHGSNNRNKIPSRWSTVHWEDLTHYTVVIREVHGTSMQFVVEHTRDDCAHACTVDDIATVLQLLPRADILGHWEDTPLEGVVLRQPTRRATTLQPVWGRYLYFCEAGPLDGPAIYLEAGHVPQVSEWPRSLNVEDQQEYDRLLRESSTTTMSKRGTRLTFDLDAVRRVQLFRTLIHEMGHRVHYKLEVEIPEEDSEDWEAIWDRYHAKSSRVKEDFAHRYAREQADRLRNMGAIPFPRMLDPDRLITDGLRLQDFVAPG